MDCIGSRNPGLHRRLGAISGERTQRRRTRPRPRLRTVVISVERLERNCRIQFGPRGPAPEGARLELPPRRRHRGDTDTPHYAAAAWRGSAAVASAPTAAACGLLIPTAGCQGRTVAGASRRRAIARRTHALAVHSVGGRFTVRGRDGHSRHQDRRAGRRDSAAGGIRSATRSSAPGATAPTRPRT
jgi:hypothetical protein